MVTVIHSKDFNVPRIFPASKISKSFLLKGFPTFYSNENEYILPVNLWLNYLQNIRSASDISCCVRAMKRYWQFLEDTGCAWNAFPPTDYLSLLTGLETITYSRQLKRERSHTQP